MQTSEAVDAPYQILGPASEADQEILSPGALDFLVDLHRRFNAQRISLLQARQARKARLLAGELPQFLQETAPVRAADWQVRPAPADLVERTVEITGPVDRKMVINALNSGANAFMADFEDSSAPTWSNMLDGQRNLRDAVNGDIDYVKPDTGKRYQLNDQTAVLLVRPRGWHLPEKHLLVDGEMLSGSLFDFGLYLFHNHEALKAAGTGPYFYLPKLESHREARLWNAVIDHAEDTLGLARGTVRVTVLIETLLAAFEMDEIPYELRDHCVGLNCGRWDYIFSFIKCLGSHPGYLLPDRADVTMDRHFLKSYVDLLIQTCHRRGAHAMGGMAAQIPIRDDDQANQSALYKVRADKEREARAGHDGTWVAHPGLIATARAAFGEVMTGPNQLQVMRGDVQVSGEDLLRVPRGAVTEQGLRHNIRVGVRYIEAWLRGQGCVPLYNLMEDAATAEISRSQIWQCLHHGAVTDTGQKFDVPQFRRLLGEELKVIAHEVGEQNFASGKYQLAAQLFEQMSCGEEFEDFLTLAAYQHID